MIPLPQSDSRGGRTMMGRLNHDQEQFSTRFGLMRLYLLITRFGGSLRFLT